MIPRINSITPQNDYKLLISFDSGESVLYDVNDDINHIDDFSILRTEEGLFENV